MVARKQFPRYTGKNWAIISRLVVAQRSQRVSGELADLVETGFQGLSMKLSKELINDLCVLEVELIKSKWRLESVL